MSKLVINHNYSGALCYAIDETNIDTMAVPHAIAMKIDGNYVETTIGGATPIYYVMTIYDGEDLMRLGKRLGLNEVQMFDVPRFSLAIDERGNVIFPFREEDRRISPRSFPSDDFTIVLRELSLTAAWRKMRRFCGWR
ncbi:hypothetical protein [Xanthobacter sediminis]|uniref:hypothetical protein n=1 Tax=Xanthobacter sediminis TaxID=3119926 RepID=UPI003726E470